MINFSEIKFGDKIYIVEEINNAFSKKRITMTDENGFVWYRYDRDHWEYDIKELEYCGKVTHVEEGEVRFEEDRLTEYHFRYPDGQIYYEWEDADLDHLENWFYTIDEAEQYVNAMKEKRNV